MLPGFLKDSYKQYKDDTDRFAAWLVNVARKCGYEPDLPLAKRTDDTKENVKPKKNKPKNTASPEYVVTIRELTKLGQVVSESSVKAPVSILAIAKRAITLRKEVTTWFLGKGSNPSTERHAHFINVMEQIYNDLEWEHVDTSKSSKTDTSDSTKTSSIQGEKEVGDEAWLNRFAALTVEEIEDTHETVSKGGELIKVTLSEDDDVVDDDMGGAYPAFFRLFCLFHDLHSWRVFISQTWKEYAELKTDIMSASIVTDNALQLARDLIREVIDSLPPSFPNDDDLDIQSLVYNTACIGRGVNDVAPSVHLGLTFNENLADIADWSYLRTGTLLKSFAPVIQPNSLPVYKSGYFGTYDPKANRETMSVAERFQEDKLLVLELMPEFCMLNMSRPLPVQDEITKGFVQFTMDKKPTLWLCFAAQMMLDAHHATRSSQLNGFADLRMSGLRIARTIEDYWKLAATHPKPKFWHSLGDEEIKRIREIVKEFIENDPFYHLRRATEADLQRSTKPSTDHLLFSRNQVLCGVFMFHLNLRMQTIGQALANQWYDVQQLAFLYNLVQKSPGSELEWPDMELFITIHGESQIFIGDRPKDVSQSLNRLEITTGISSATRFASNSRKGNNPWHRPDGKSRMLVPTTKAANLFRDYYQESSIDPNSTQSMKSGELSKFLDELAGAKAKPSNGSKGNNGFERERSLATPEHLLHRKWQNTHNIGPLQLLALIKEKLWEEEPVLTFNYFAMHERCIEILRMIRAKEHDKFVQYFTTGYMPDETMLSNLVILIHHVARGSAQGALQMGVAAQNDSSVLSRMVMSCGDMMKTYLAKKGGVVTKEMRIFCKNKKQFVKESNAEGEEKKKKKQHSNFMYWFSLEEVLGPAGMESLKTGIPLA